MTSNPKSGRVYAIVDWSTPMDESSFLQCRVSGVICNELTTLRTSLTGQQVIMKWRGEMPQALSSRVLWSGSHEEICAKLVADADIWGGETADSLLIKNSQSSSVVWPWVAAAAAAGAGALIYLFNS